jgi:GDPmannose 4,6-dehydratase
MLQQDHAEDYVIATGEQHSVREFVERAAGEIGVSIAWQGVGSDAFGTVVNAPKESALKCGQRIVAVDPHYFRPTEVETLLGDASKAEQRLGWRPRTSFPALVREMMQADLTSAKRDALVGQAGYPVARHHE